MERIYIKELPSKTGQIVTVKGWVHNIRRKGAISFLILREITGMVQCVVLKENKTAFETLEPLTNEAVVEITGKVVELPESKGVEIQVEGIKVLSVADPILPILVEEKGGNEPELDKRLDWRWIDLRKPKKQLIFKTWTIMEQALESYWINNGYTRIYSPKLMSTPSESGAELFEVKYFEGKAYLAQSPQFYKQMAMASGFEKIFEVGPVFRANPSFTVRHDTEFTGYDAEISFVESHQDVMQEQQKALHHMLKIVKETYGEEILKEYGREVAIPTLPFPQVTMAEAKAILKGMGVVREQEGDLSPEEERKLCEYIKSEYNHEFVYVTEYTVSIRPFYHMRKEENPELTKSFDLLWNGHEITTGAQREHRYQVLIKQAKEKGLELEPLQHYLNFFKYGCPPHGGFGMSPTRMLMKIFNISNVREVTYIYRGVKRLTP